MINMDDEQIRNLASESPQNRIGRDNLTQELEKLQAIVRNLNALSASNFKSAPRPPAFGQLFSSTPSPSSAVVNYPAKYLGISGQILPLGPTQHLAGGRGLTVVSLGQHMMAALAGIAAYSEVVCLRGILQFLGLVLRSEEEQPEGQPEERTAPRTN